MCSPMPDIPDEEIEFTDADIVRMIKQDLEDGLYNEASLNERERQYLIVDALPESRQQPPVFSS